MTSAEAAQLLYEKWLVLAISPEVKTAIRTICRNAGLPDPAPQRRSESGHPWGDDEPTTIGVNVR